MGGVRIGSLFRPFGQRLDKAAEVKAGEIVALAKVDALSAGQVVSAAGITPVADFPPAESPVFTLALAAKNRNDEVKLSGALHKITEEDPSLAYEQRAETHELLLKGQGEMHLKVAVEKLAGRYNVAVETMPPKVAYRESIQQGTSQHARYKRQTGGHGQFADIKIEIRPLPRGSGFRFVDKIVGGVVPRNFIPAVEEGCGEFLKEGPLGQPVVDIEVTLVDGQYHAVDSSEMSFKMASRIALTEGLPKCKPVLLEPILKVTVAAPSDATSRIQRLISGPARPAPGLRRAAGLDRLGRGLGPDARGRGRRHDRRDPFGHPGRRHLPHRVRPPAGAGRPHRRPDRRRRQRSGQRRSARRLRWELLTGVPIDAAQCPFPDARYRDRSGEDPGLARRPPKSLGYHGIEVADHVFGAAPRGDWKPTYSEYDPFHETFTTMAFIAAVTKKVELVSGVLILPQRQTGLVAKQAAQVDILSGGRLRLGVGRRLEPCRVRGARTPSGRPAARGRPSRSR